MYNPSVSSNKITGHLALFSYMNDNVAKLVSFRVYIRVHALGQQYQTFWTQVFSALLELGTVFAAIAWG